MRQDMIHKLREAQRHLDEAARAVHGASVNIKMLLAKINAHRQHPSTTDERSKGDDQ